ncbi:ribosomal RNA-processing protein 7 homolog A-like [Chenopodium quinoa]|uniref:Ribosomal RNA-processing protein 7 C-terminal domain-containing protein n=1 Tax=Chenopodium quinoa TaxID=63459 RepID=A0A803LNS6_CHEQI|nr:ribosomal RNA-processing protein 7 homolog A-like [Chenopodium quinoa]
MGSNKLEKKMNKMKIKKRCRELLEKGESAGNACTLEHDGKYPIVKKNKDNVAGVDQKAYKSKKARKSKIKDNHPSEPSIVVIERPDSEVSCKNIKGKSKKAHKKKMDGQSTNKKIKSVKEVQEVAMDDVYEISSVDEDDSKGMKKWIKEFHVRRPGLKVLQEQIDNFITAHEEQEEQAKREREAKLAEEGWTVVVHRKGGKRTTDPDSGVAVGSVAEAAVRDKLAKKKSKDVGLDFYRFQRKEAHRSDIMKLQSKFEEDKKRIQQIRAARKFKPY